MSLTRAPATSDRSEPYFGYVPRLLEEPWDGARIVAGSVAYCEIIGLSAEATEKNSTDIDGILNDLVRAAQDEGGDVLSLSAEAVGVLFSGEGRHGRALNAVHAMHDVFAAGDGPAAGAAMSAGIASGLVHVITAGKEPRQLITVGPAVTRAIELSTIAGSGNTMPETVDRSAMETHGKAIALPRSAFLDPAVRDAIESGGGAPTIQQATIAVATFSGVDRALQRNPAKAAAQIADLVEAVQQAAAEYGITLLHTDLSPGGGRFALAAGVPEPTVDGEEGMIQAAKAALAAEPPFALRFGIATGEVRAGELGGETRRTYTAIGATVDLASRLAASASPGEVLTTHRAIDRATTRYAISEWDPVSFVGMAGHVVPVVVGQELGPESAQDVGGLVGRSEEHAIIRRLLEQLELGRGGIVDIVGDAGIGKTRLVEEALRESDTTSVVVRGEEYRQDIPYGAAARLLRAAIGIDEHEDPTQAGILLKAHVRDLTPYLLPLLPLIAEVAEAEVAATDAVEELAPSFHRERTQWAVSQLAVWLTRRPIVVRFEDAHWIDAASADLLSYVLARGADLPWLVISARRRGETGWIPGDDLDPSRIDLKPLAPGASRALLTELRRDNPLQPDVSSDLIERSGGNPYLLERLAATAGESKTLPGNVEAAAKTQLTRLSTADRKTLAELSVLGRRFDPDLAEEVIGVEDWSVFGDVLETEWDGFLRFRQPIVHDAAYASLPAARRRDLHLRTGAALAERSAGPELLTMHFHRAGAHQETWEMGRVAGKRALARNAPMEAATLLDRALASARRLRSTPIAPRAETAELLGDALCWAGQTKDGDKAYVAAEDLAKTKRDRARLVRKRAMLRQHDGQYPAALRMLTAAIKALPKAAGPGERAELELAYAGVRLRQGRYPEVIERCDLAIQLAEKAGDETAVGRAHYLRGRALSRIESGSGVEDGERALAIFEKSGDHLMQAKVLDMLGSGAYERGKWDETLALEERSAKQRELAGDAVGSAVAGFRRALVLVNQGKFDEAEPAFEEIRSASRAANYRLGVAMASMHLANGVARAGDSESALGILKETLAEFEDLGDGRCIVFNRLAQAEAHLLGGGVEAALERAEEALASAGSVPGTEGPIVGLQRVRGVALVWRGNTKEGHVQLLEALEEARRVDAAFEEVLILDTLATLYGDDKAVDQRDVITSRLGIVKLPPFLTVS